MQLRLLALTAVLLSLSRPAVAAPTQSGVDREELVVIVAVRDAFKHNPAIEVLIPVEGWGKKATPEAMKKPPELGELFSNPWKDCVDRKAKLDAVMRNWCERNRKDSRLPVQAAAGNPFLRFGEVERFPQLRFSRVGFSADRLRAFVSFDYACPLCGHGYDVWLTRDAKGWHVEQSKMRWVS